MPDVSLNGIEFTIKGSTDAASKSIDKLIQKLDKLKSAVQAAPKVSLLSNTLGIMKADLEKASGSLSKFGKFALKGVSYPLRAAYKDVKGFVKGISGAIGGFKRILGYRMIRTIIKEIGQAFKEGTDNLYQWSTLVGGQFAKNMDDAATSMLYFKNSLGAMWSPLMNVLAPALRVVTDAAVNLMNAINQMLAILTGQSSWTRAKRMPTTYADALDDTAEAAKKAMHYLAPFDELNVLPDMSDSGRGGKDAVDYSQMFEEIAEFDEKIASFATRLKDAIAKADWKGLGTLLGGQVNKLVDSVKWESVGKQIGDKINSWFSTKYWTLNTINFKNIGKKIAELLTGKDGIGGVLRSIDFSELGGILALKLTMLPDVLIGALGNLDATLVGESIRDFVTGFYNQVTFWLNATDWADLGYTLVTKIRQIFTADNIVAVAQSIWGFFNASWEAAKDLFSGIWKAIINGEPIDAGISFKFSLGKIFGLDQEKPTGVVAKMIGGKNNFLSNILEILNTLGNGAVVFNPATRIGSALGATVFYDLFVKLGDVFTEPFEKKGSKFGKYRSKADWFVTDVLHLPSDAEWKEIGAGIKKHFNTVFSEISEGFTDWGKRIKLEFNVVIAWFKDLPNVIKQAVISAINSVGEPIERKINELVEKHPKLASMLGIDGKVEFQLIPDIDDAELHKNLDRAKAELEEFMEQTKLKTEVEATAEITNIIPALKRSKDKVLAGITARIDDVDTSKAPLTKIDALGEIDKVFVGKFATPSVDVKGEITGATPKLKEKVTLPATADIDVASTKSLTAKPRIASTGVIDDTTQSLTKPVIASTAKLVDSTQSLTKPVIPSTGNINATTQTLNKKPSIASDADLKTYTNSVKGKPSIGSVADLTSTSTSKNLQTPKIPSTANLEKFTNSITDKPSVPSSALLNAWDKAKSLGTPSLDSKANITTYGKSFAGKASIDSEGNITSTSVDPNITKPSITVKGLVGSVSVDSGISKPTIGGLKGDITTASVSSSISKPTVDARGFVNSASVAAGVSVSIPATAYVTGTVTTTPDPPAWTDTESWYDVKTCPDCRSTNSSTRTKCGKCGFPLNAVNPGLSPSPPQYLAKGGFPNTGELYWARENGISEMVGRIGNRHAVVNNDQIVASVSNGIARTLDGIRLNVSGPAATASPAVSGMADEETMYRAFRRALDETDFGGDVELDGDTLYRAMVRRNNANTRMTGVNAMAMA